MQEYTSFENAAETLYSLSCPLCKHEIIQATLIDLEVGLQLECSNCNLSIQLDR